VTLVTTDPKLSLPEDSPSDTFEHLQDELSVQLISTPRRLFKTCYAHELAADVAARYEREFDFLPVLKPGINDNGPLIIGLLDLSMHPNTSVAVEEVMSPLSEDNLIGADAGILEFLRDADQRPCRLIVAGSAITSLVSLSDIQRLPVRASLFAMITHLEMTMADAIRRVHKNTEWITKLAPQRVTKIDEEMKQSKLNDCFVDPLLFAQFGDKVTIVRKSEALVDSKTKFEKDMKSAQDLRNRLAHANEFASTRVAAADVCRTIRAIDFWIDRLKQWPM
jgi:hypothetical protein